MAKTTMHCPYCKEHADTGPEIKHKVACPMTTGTGVERAKKLVLKYDVPAGDPGKPCRVCGRNIHFVKTKNGKWIPIEWDGTPHFGNCSEWDGEKYRRQKAISEM